jgi:hypothetical protein
VWFAQIFDREMRGEKNILRPSERESESERSIYGEKQRQRARQRRTLTHTYV